MPTDRLFPLLPRLRPILVGVFALVFFAAAFPPAATAADLTVRLLGVRNADGNLRLALFDRADGFRKEDKARALRQVPAAPGVVAVVFDGLPPGRYAVMAYHDENADGALDRFLGMIPTEGYGLSNNPEVMGPPDFEQTAFDIPAVGAEIAVDMRY